MHAFETIYPPLLSHIIFIRNFIVVSIKKLIVYCSRTEWKFVTRTLCNIIINKQLIKKNFVLKFIKETSLKLEVQNVIL